MTPVGVFLCVAISDLFCTFFRSPYTYFQPSRVTSEQKPRLQRFSTSFQLNRCDQRLQNVRNNAVIEIEVFPLRFHCVSPTFDL